MTTLPLLSHSLLEKTGALDDLKSGATWVAQVAAKSYEDTAEVFSPITDRIPIVGPLSVYPFKLAGGLWAVPAMALSAYDGYFDLSDVVLENPNATATEQFGLIAQQANAGLSPIADSVNSALLFTEPRAQVTQAAAQMREDPAQVDFAALNHGLTTSTLDSLVTWAGLVPPLWQIASGTAGLAESGLNSLVRAGDSFAAGTLERMGSLGQPGLVGAGTGGGQAIIGGTLEGVGTVEVAGVGETITAGSSSGIKSVGVSAMFPLSRLSRQRSGKGPIRDPSVPSLSDEALQEAFKGTSSELIAEDGAIKRSGISPDPALHERHAQLYLEMRDRGLLPPQEPLKGPQVRIKTTPAKRLESIDDFVDVCFEGEPPNAIDEAAEAILWPRR